MQKKKIFIEIQVPETLQKRLTKRISQWDSLPVKWAKQQNLHLTVAFVGFVDEMVIPEICQKVEDAVADIEMFDIDFDTIELGPNVEDPHMIWLTGKPNESLKELNRAIEAALGTDKRERKEFRPHVTLGKLKKIKWDALNEKPTISEKYPMTIAVEQVVVMESSGGGNEYLPLQYCPLA